MDKNINPSTLNSNTIQVVSAGPDGILGTADDVTIPLTNVSFNVTPLKNGRLGPEQISFTLPAGLTNNLYQVTLDGQERPRSPTSPATRSMGRARREATSPGSS